MPCTTKVFRRYPLRSGYTFNVQEIYLHLQARELAFIVINTQYLQIEHHVQKMKKFIYKTQLVDLRGRY